MSIFIGKKNGRIGFWAAAPGYDASQEVAKWIANSDYDHLKLLHPLTAEISGSPAGSGLYVYPEATAVSWPDLGYTPLCFVTIRGNTYSKQYYPFTSEMWADAGTSTFGAMFWRVYSDHLTIASGASQLLAWSKVEVTCHVFENSFPTTELV